ncbi:MAG: hypothetical protein RQ833_04320 [Sphingomonadaceae bacterium]|nr:hypothetical protein [Sphingomonadaceae bacterium]
MGELSPDEAVARAALIDARVKRAEEVMLRLAGTREAREATARSLKRTARDISVRIQRSVGAMGITGVGLVGYGLATTGIVGLDLMIAGALAVPAVGAAALMIPTRRKVERPEQLAQTPLDRLSGAADEWLGRVKIELPRASWQEADRVRSRLVELQPLLAGRAPGDAEAIEARRLIGEHLPRLVRASLALPPAQRGQPEAARELNGGLAVIGGELGRLTETIAAAKVDALRVESRFLENRYR